METITGRSCSAQVLAVQQKNSALPTPSLAITPFPQGKVRVPKSQEVLLLLPVEKRGAACSSSVWSGRQQAYLNPNTKCIKEEFYEF